MNEGVRRLSVSPFGMGRRGFGFGNEAAAVPADESDKVSELGTRLLRDSKQNPVVTVANLKNLHSLLTLDDATAGELRTIRVVGSHMFYRFYRVFAPTEEVPLLLEAFEKDINGDLQDWNAVQKAFFAFGMIVMFIHPVR